jgi:hypothetical protein
MKKTVYISVLLLAALFPFSAPAQDQSQPMPMMDHCKAMMANQQEMKASMDAMNAKLNELAAVMNNSKGDKKVDAMAAVINELMTQRTAMHEKMARMQPMMHHMTGYMKTGTTQSMPCCPMMQSMPGCPMMQMQQDEKPKSEQ